MNYSSIRKLSFLWSQLGQLSSTVDHIVAALSAAHWPLTAHGIRLRQLWKSDMFRRIIRCILEIHGCHNKLNSYHVCAACAFIQVLIHTFIYIYIHIDIYIYIFAGSIMCNLI